ncbi:MAG: HRDC domain-containing protein [Paludibacteraceae bacterium]|nr:HRDC domain-containing protein [Paludibacteraceae bacterium]MBR0064144.1 HRDC domain-containing protein [Paludibacteraceae bacterium]
MQVKIFTIPIFDNENAVNELNAFLRAQKILTVDKQLSTQGAQAFWTFCVSYLPQTIGGNTYSGGTKATKVDYKEVLDEKTFAVFSQLRSIRKQLAEQEAVPAYAVFTDSELAEIAKLETIDMVMIQTIPGIGAKRAEKYGKSLCESYMNAKKETET